MDKGTGDTLLPILKMKNIIETIDLQIDSVNTESLNELKTAVSSSKLLLSKKEVLPNEERDFKRIFDEYSEGISYRQRYLDKNAFLV